VDTTPSRENTISLSAILLLPPTIRLAGYRHFLLDNASLSALQNSKQRSAMLDGVRFESKPFLKDTPDLIAFIAEKTGKMRALAAADLDSHLVLAEEF